VQKERFNEQAARYIENIGLVEGIYLLKHDVKPNLRLITLVYGGSTLTEEQKESIRQKADGFSLTDTRIEFEQGLTFDKNTGSSEEMERMKSELQRLNLLVLEKNRQIERLSGDDSRGLQMMNELRTLYPDILNFSVSASMIFSDRDTVGERTEICVLRTSGKQFSNSDKEKINNWLKARLQTGKIRVFYEN